MDIAASIEILRQILGGLQAAHQAHVLHRDINPDAIVIETGLDAKLHARLTGFGLAKHLGDEDDDPTAITMTGQVIGNPAYMAPETIMRGILDPQTDVYALGVTTYEMVTGERPFPGTSLSEMLAAHIQGTPERPSSLRAEIPPYFEQLIQKMIANDPSNRYESAEDVLFDLVIGEQRALESGHQPEAPVSKTTRSDWWLVGLFAFVTVLALIIMSI